MAERPIWRGHLRLALVSCPVALFNARHERAALRFHFINPETGHRVKMITQDAETGQELSRRDLVKGYEFKKEHYLIMTDEDFESARVESSGVMTIDKFVPASSIDPIFYDSSYYLVPDGDAGKDVYAVLREAIRKSGRIALSRVVIARRERAIALMPSENGMVVHTLYEERDINSPKALFERAADLKPEADMVQLATQLIDRQTGVYDPADMEDRYEAKLRAVIEAKLKGEGIDVEAEEEPDRGNVIDLMAALKKSLGQTPPAPERTEKKAPKKAAASRGKADDEAPPRAAAASAKRATRKRA
ncbi:MAG: Ku protein [Acetobacteraceae bacterium]|nr:Ku protein [Acetobacteraceae bacterium]